MVMKHGEIQRPWIILCHGMRWQFDGIYKRLRRSLDRLVHGNDTDVEMPASQGEFLPVGNRDEAECGLEGGEVRANSGIICGNNQDRFCFTSLGLLDGSCSK